MNKALISGLVYFLYTSTFDALANESKPIDLIGHHTGNSLGSAAYLSSLVRHHDQPLRVAYLAGSSTLNPTIFQYLTQARADWNWQLISESDWQEIIKQDELILITAPHNRLITQLADKKNVDLVLHSQIQILDQSQWLLITLFSGVDGSVLYNAKLALSESEPEQKLSELSQNLRDLKMDFKVNDYASWLISGGEIHLRTSPSHMQVYLNDVPLGTSPLITRYIPPGQHLLHLFEDERYLLQRIRILSEPPGINVQVNQQNLGQTPLDLPIEFLEPGQFEIQFQSPNNTRFKAEIQVQSKPEGVPVQLNQSPIKRTPISFQELDQSSYTLSIAPLHAIDLKIPLEITPDSSQVLALDAYKYAKLIVNSSISNAELSIDQEIVGNTPYSSNLSQGLHSLKISKNRYRPETHLIQLNPGKTHEIFFDLKPRSADTSIFLTPTGELTPQLNIATKYLGFGNITLDQKSELAHLYGLEIDYGWPQIFRFLDTFDIGIELSAFLFNLQTASLWRNFQGIGSKFQFLKESDSIPISAALGAYLNVDLNRPKLVGYLSLSRNFGDFALHLGMQSHGFNLNIGYTGWENIRLSGLIYADSFLKLLSESQENSSTFYGVQFGYSF